MQDLVTKRSALAAWVTTTLQAVDTDFQVEQRTRKVMLSGGTAREVKAVMGDPIRYASVIKQPSGYDTSDEHMDARERSLRRVDQFQITVLYQFQDSDDYETSSQKNWDALLYDSTTGLYHLLNQLTSLESGTIAVRTPDPLQDIIVDVMNQVGGPLLCHQASFTINLD